jgi:hypothetical protein
VVRRKIVERDGSSIWITSKERLFKCADSNIPSKEPPTSGMIKNKEISKTHADAIEYIARLAFDSAASQ